MNDVGDESYSNDEDYEYKVDDIEDDDDIETNLATGSDEDEENKCLERGIVEMNQKRITSRVNRLT